MIFTDLCSAGTWTGKSSQALSQNYCRFSVKVINDSDSMGLKSFSFFPHQWQSFLFWEVSSLLNGNGNRSHFHPLYSQFLLKQLCLGVGLSFFFFFDFEETSVRVSVMVQKKHV